MTHPPVEDLRALRARIDHLQRHQRRHGRVAIAVALACVALPLTAATVAASLPDVVQARSFELLDAEDRVRGRWSTGAGGEPGFALVDAEGRDRVRMFEKGGEWLIVLRDGENRTRLGVSLDQRGNPHVNLLDATQKPKLHVSVGDSGQPSILFFDQDGSRPLGMGVDAKGAVWTLPADK